VPGQSGVPYKSFLAVALDPTKVDKETAGERMKRFNVVIFVLNFDNPLFGGTVLTH